MRILQDRVSEFSFEGTGDYHVKIRVTAEDLRTAGLYVVYCHPEYNLYACVTGGDLNESTPEWQIQTIYRHDSDRLYHEQRELDEKQQEKLLSLAKKFCDLNAVYARAALELTNSLEED